MFRVLSLPSLPSLPSLSSGSVLKGLPSSLVGSGSLSLWRPEGEVEAGPRPREAEHHGVKGRAGLGHGHGHGHGLEGATQVQRLHTTVPCPGWGTLHRPYPRGQRRMRHKLPQWRAGRAAKFLRPDLPDVEFQRRAECGQISPEEFREKMKKSGTLPPARETERPIYVSSTGDVIDKFVPPEGDGRRASVMSKEGASTAITGVTGKGKSFMAARKIRQYEEDFNPKTFGEKATQIYIDAHQALANRNFNGLHDLVTEKVYPEMVHNIDSKTMQWQYLQGLEPPRVVHVRTMSVVTKTNLFAQVTVRMNSQQTLAVYDRFGRLIHGSPHVAKDVLEYVVFEKHISHLYGSWRLHSKIVPEWMPERPPSRLTYLVTPEKPEDLDDDKDERTKGEEVKQMEEELAVKDDEERVFNRFGQEIKRSGK